MQTTVGNDGQMDRQVIATRAEELYNQQKERGYHKVDRIFAILMVAQWIFGIAVALFLSPYAWEGKAKVVHLHVYTAVFLGAALSAFPILMTWLRPGSAVTRHVIAAAQMLWSALLIHLTGGRIETHFHVFGSLAFLAFYYDWPVLITATVVVAGDHLLRGILWPESVYGILNPEWWRFLEHAFWVVFEDIVLVMSCRNGLKEMRDGTARQAEMEALREQEQLKSAALEMVLKEMKKS